MEIFAQGNALRHFSFTVHGFYLVGWRRLLLIPPRKLGEGSIDAKGKCERNCGK